MKRLALVAMILVVNFAFAATSQADVIGFDDLLGGGSSSYLPVGYAGLNWDSNWFHWDFAQDPYTPSSPNTRIATHNSGGYIDFSPLGVAVDFEGAYFSGMDYVDCYIKGYLGGSLVGTSATLTLSSTPTFLNANFGGLVDYVNIVSSYENHFAVDDVTYQPVPVPGAVLLGMLGLSVAGARLRKRS
jgi:hypothetical protein